MSDDLDGFFTGAIDDEYGPQRDRYGRPMLVPTAEYPGLSAETRVLARDGNVRVPYTRASSMANYIADFEQLHRWQKRRLAKGLGERPDLAAMAAALPRFQNDRKKDLLTNARLDEIIWLASEIGQVHEQANHGTAVHLFTEPGVETGPVPERMRDDVASFYRALREKGIVVLETEVFVANDRLKAAGTVDHVLWVPGYGKCLGDKKTGDLKPLEFAIQFATYRGGERYDWETDERTPWDDDLSADVGWVIDIPAGQGKTLLHKLDLRWGAECAAIAADVRDRHTDSRNRIQKDMGDEIVGHFLAEREHASNLIADAGSREECEAIYDLYKMVWEPRLTQQVTEHLAALEETA